MNPEAQTLVQGVVNPTYACKSGSLALFRDLHVALWDSYFDTVRDEPGPIVRHVLTAEREWNAKTDYYVLKLSDSSFMRLVVQHTQGSYICLPYVSHAHAS